MRLLHSADWHLGQTLHGVSRDHEHGLFLDWLLGQLEEHAVDVLVVAGDVFDGQNPPVGAQRLLYRFLARARRLRPALTVVLIAGNHDSGGRLEAPSPLLDELGVHVVGALGDPGRLVVPLPGPDGETAAWCAAVPYLRLSDLEITEAAEAGGPDPVVEGVRAVYNRVFEAARTRRQPGQALIATGHCYMAGGALSELSERRILGGNLHALPADLFPADVDYVALGHLHRAQRVGGREAVRYSGSPLPLALSEAGYRHQVVLATFREGALAGLDTLPVPRFVQILRLSGRPEQLPALLAALPQAADRRERDGWPLLELTVSLERPEPGLRAAVDELLAGRAVRLVRLATESGGDGRSLADGAGAVALATLAPEDVFRRCWQRSHRAEPAPEHLAAFHELLDGAEADF